MSTFKVRSDDAEIVYEVLGSGPTVVLLHPFPVNRNFWLPVAKALSGRYRFVLPDLRGHGESGAGSGPATMEKQAADILRVCDEAGIGKAVFAGVSIGGYVLMEFWRRSRERVSALVLADTRAQADTDETRKQRLQSADDVERCGPDQFLDGLLPKLLGETTRRNRPDLVDRARRMAMKMSVLGIAAVQRGMAARPDSVPTLQTINVSTLLLFGDEDVLTPPTEGQFMQARIPRSSLKTVPQAGHYAAFEQQEDAVRIVSQFLDGCS